MPAQPTSARRPWLPTYLPESMRADVPHLHYVVGCRGQEVPAGTPLPPGARRGVLVGLATGFPADGPEPLRAWRADHPEHRAHDDRDLSLVPTVFDRLDEGLCRALVHRGWWLMGAALATYHPRRLPPTLGAPPL